MCSEWQGQWKTCCAVTTLGKLGPHWKKWAPAELLLEEKGTCCNDGEPTLVCHESQSKWAHTASKINKTKFDRVEKTSSHVHILGGVSQRGQWARSGRGLVLYSLQAKNELLGFQSVSHVYLKTVRSSGCGLSMLIRPGLCLRCQSIPLVMPVGSLSRERVEVSAVSVPGQGGRSLGFATSSFFKTTLQNDTKPTKTRQEMKITCLSMSWNKFKTSRQNSNKLLILVTAGLLLEYNVDLTFENLCDSHY